MKVGVLLATEGCLPSALGARVRRSGGKTIVTDGPFTESKELIAGFALLQANSKEEAIKLVQEFLDVAGDGECGSGRSSRRLRRVRPRWSSITPSSRNRSPEAGSDPAAPAWLPHLP